MSKPEYTHEELLSLDHNDHEAAFRGYLRGSRHASDKQGFLMRWIEPAATDRILECGSSSGKTSVELVRQGAGYCLGVDFDPEAVRISSAMRDEYFPELKHRCDFHCGDLTQMAFNTEFNKILMPDFSEHIPDKVFAEILANLGRQLEDARLYIYTPLRSHIFEILKHNGILLKNPSGHINVKTREELTRFLTENGWEIETLQWRASSIPIFRHVEGVLGHFPFLGRFFQRRIAIVARRSVTA